MLFTVRGVFSFLLYTGSINHMLSQGLEQKQVRGFPWQKNNKMLLLATKRKTNSYHMKKKKREKRKDGKNEFQGVFHRESQDVWAANRYK